MKSSKYTTTKYNTIDISPRGIFQCCSQLQDIADKGYNVFDVQLVYWSGGNLDFVDRFALVPYMVKNGSCGIKFEWESPFRRRYTVEQLANTLELAGTFFDAQNAEENAWMSFDRQPLMQIELTNDYTENLHFGGRL